MDLKGKVLAHAGHDRDSPGVHATAPIDPANEWHPIAQSLMLAMAQHSRFAAALFNFTAAHHMIAQRGRQPEHFVAEPDRIIGLPAFQNLVITSPMPGHHRMGNRKTLPQRESGLRDPTPSFGVHRRLAGGADEPCRSQRAFIDRDTCPALRAIDRPNIGGR